MFTFFHIFFSCSNIIIFIIFLDSSKYAQFLFNAFDKDKNGSLSFEVRIFN